MPATDLSSSPDRWLVVPTPLEPKVILPGLALAILIRSATLLPGNLLPAPSTVALRQTRLMGARSFSTL